MNPSDSQLHDRKRLPREVFRPWQAASPGLILGCAIVYTFTNLPLSFQPGETLFAAGFGLIALLTVLSSVLELQSGSADPAGIFGFIREILNQHFSFLAGWSFLLGTSAVTAALTLEFIRQLQVIIPILPSESMLVPLTLLTVLVLLELIPNSPLRRIHWALLVALIAGTLLLVGQAWFTFEPERVFTPGRVDMTTTMHIAAMMVIFIVPFEQLLNSNSLRSSSSPLRPLLLLGGALLLISIAGFAITTRVHTQLQVGGIPLTSILAEHTGSPLLATFIPLLVIIFGLHNAVMTNAHQLNRLCRAGLLPDMLRRFRKPFDMPVPLFVSILLLALPWFAIQDTELVLASGSGLISLSLILLNAAVMVSRIKEPERRRSFATPLFPLIPAVSTLLLGALLFTIPGEALLLNGLLLAAGAVIFYTYGRQHAIEASEGSIRFTPQHEADEENPDRYRILLPLTPGQERHLALKIAVSLSRQLDASLIPLQIIPTPDPLAMQEGRRLARERNILFQWSLNVAERAGVVIKPVTRFARSIADGIIEAAAEEQCDLILMPWTVGEPSRGVQLGHILDPVLNGATCDVAVVAFHDHKDSDKRHTSLQPDTLPVDIHFDFTPSRIMVPTAGGPNAPLAFRIAPSLANEASGSVTAVNVAHPDATSEELAAGQDRIHQTIEALKLEASKLAAFQAGRHPMESISFDSLVIKAENVADGIVEAARDFDLVLLGASEERIIDQMLLGTIPEQVARSSQQPTIMVKRFRGLRRYWLQRIWKLFFELVPTLNQEERIEVYRSVRRGARPDIDYFIMMGLSAAIATFGLLQNSSAVIIGAMLVAPLFTPILALSLSIVQGDTALFMVAVESSIKGIALAIGLAIVLTSLSPITLLTNEILIRSQPNMFDLLIALASGVAGAYAIARKDVATALPGVAIAAALVPPLSVIGVGLAQGNLGIAGGSLLLFFTNLVAIILSGVITLLLLGFLPRRRDQQDIRLRWALFISMFSLGLILIPLVSISTRTLRELNSRQTISTLLEQQAASEGMILDRSDVSFDSDSIKVSVQFLTEEPVPENFIEELQSEIEEVSRNPISLNLTILSIEAIESISTTH